MSRMYEEKLNRILSENFSEEEAVREFLYYTNKSRGESCSINTIRRSYYQGKLGSLMKRLDPIRFNVGMNGREL